MVTIALPGIFVMGCLVHVYLMDSYVIRCPEQAEWNIRAEIRCQNEAKYFCLYNDIDYSYQEGCTGPDWDRPGSKRIYSRNFNRAPCNDTRYQPIKFVTNGNSDCIFRKSLCTEEGQTLFEAGTTRTDSTCRCDYKQGYAFVTVPRNKCYCHPSEEDCSCYLKKCQDIGYYLSADYECTKNGTKKTVCSLMSENPSEDPHIDMAPTGTPREYDSYAIKRTDEVAILVSICLVFMIDLPIVTVTPGQQSIIVGNPVTLGCLVQADPMHTTVVWRKMMNGVATDLPANSRYSGSTVSNPSLSITSVQSGDIGNYVCYATNSVGTGQSTQTFLNVVGNLPSVTVTPGQQSIIVGNPEILGCSVQADPMHTTVVWSLVNGVATDLPANSRYSGSTVSNPSLSITSVQSGDIGNYVCYATNSVGTGQSTQTFLNVVGNGNRLKEIVSENNGDNQNGLSGENQKSAVDELKDNIDKEGTDAVLKHLNEDLNNWRNEPVKLAVTGKSGVGKSSFINAIRNLKTGEPDFATSSCPGNTTEQATVYQYPGNPKITLHDLPGYGTAKLPTNDYVKTMKLNKYDYILIFVGNIEENDLEIANKIKAMEKPFCFVRSKIDIDIINAKNDGESEKDAVEKIISKSIDNLECAVLNKAKFFVISNHNRKIYQFNELVSYIQKNLPALKCDVVMFSLSGEFTDDVIDNKYLLLIDRLLKVSVASVGLDTGPVSIMDRFLKKELIVQELLLYHKTYGFEQQSVKDILKVDCVRQKLSANSIIEIHAAKAMREFVDSELAKLKESRTRGPHIQSIDSVVMMWPAGGITFILLNQTLDSCRDDAQLVYSHIRNVDV